MSHEILKTKNEISMVLRGRKSIAPIFFPFLTLGCGQPTQHVIKELARVTPARPGSPARPPASGASTSQAPAPQPSPPPASDGLKWCENIWRKHLPLIQNVVELKDPVLVLVLLRSRNKIGQ